MKRLMKVVASAACVGAMLSFAGCGNSNTPEQVAIEQANGVLKDLDVDGTLSCRVQKSEVNGDKAIVYIDIVNNGKVETTEKFELEKVNGVWLDPKNTAEYVSIEYMKRCAEKWQKKEADKGVYTFKAFKEDVAEAEKLGIGQIRVAVMKDGQKCAERRASVTKVNGVWRSDWE